jgi:hypothetical protein
LYKLIYTIIYVYNGLLFVERPTGGAYVFAGVVGGVSFLAVHFDVCLVRTAVSARDWV